MLSLLAAVMLAQTPDVPPPPPPPPPAAEPAPAPAPPAAAAAPAPPDAPVRGPSAYAGRSRGWLIEEKKWLEESRPVIAPHALIAGGGAALLFAAILNAVVRPGFGGNGQIPGGWLAVFGIMGGAGMVTGGIFFFFAWQKAGQVDAEIDAVKDALRGAPDDGTDDRPPPGYERDDAPPAMPPAMPPQVQLPPAPVVNVLALSF